jgi:hypothetical protein
LLPDGTSGCTELQPVLPVGFANRERRWALFAENELCCLLGRVPEQLKDQLGAAGAKWRGV